MRKQIADDNEVLQRLTPAGKTPDIADRIQVFFDDFCWNDSGRCHIPKSLKMNSSTRQSLLAHSNHDSNQNFEVLTNFNGTDVEVDDTLRDNEFEAERAD